MGDYDEMVDAWVARSAYGRAAWKAACDLAIEAGLVVAHELDYACREGLNPLAWIESIVERETP